MAEAVLLRTLKPTRGIELMEQYRHTTDVRRLTNEPASLVQASARIGITKATDKLWRFTLDI